MSGVNQKWRAKQWHMEETVAKSRKVYRNAMIRKPVSSLEFLFGQMRTVRREYWFLQLILLSIVIGSLMLMERQELSITNYEYFTVMSPLITLCSIPELWRNVASGAYEVETTTYFDLRKVYFARLVLVGMMDLLVLTILVLGMANISDYSIYECAIYFFVPFNLTCGVCFFLLCFGKKVHSQSLAIGICIMVGVCWYAMVNQLKLYEWVQMRVWCGLLFFSLIYLGYACQRSIKTCRHYCEMEN